MYQIIFSLPCTTETKLLQKINLLYSYPIGAHRVKLPHNWGILPSIKHILTLDTRKSEKKLGNREWPLLWNCLSFLPWQNQTVFFPYSSILKLKGICSVKLYFRFVSIPPAWETEQYKPAQHLLLISEYYGWWNFEPEKFIDTVGANSLENSSLESLNK